MGTEARKRCGRHIGWLGDRAWETVLPAWVIYVTGCWVSPTSGHFADIKCWFSLHFLIGGLSPLACQTAQPLWSHRREVFLAPPWNCWNGLQPHFIGLHLHFMASQVSQWQRIHLPMQETHETWVLFLGQEGPLELEMATCSSILARKIPRTEEPDGLLSMGPQRVTRLSYRTHTQTHPHFILNLGCLDISFVLIRDLALMSVPHCPASWRWLNAFIQQLGFPVESASRAWLVCEVVFVLLWGSNLGDGWAVQNFLLRCVLTFMSFIFSLLLFNIHFYLFVCAGIFSCCIWALIWGLWDLVPWTGINFLKSGLNFLICKLWIIMILIL